jgi:hypothetical protein
MVLQLPHWSREEHHLFPAEFRAVVWQLVRGHYSAASVLNTVPMDVLELVIAHLACSWSTRTIRSIRRSPIAIGKRRNEKERSESR